MSKEKIKIASGYVLICAIWGSTWLVIRLGLDSLIPFISAGIRFILASIFIYVLMRFRNIKLQKDILSIKLYIMLTFFSYVFPYGLVYWSEQFIPSGLTAIVFATMPFFVLIFSLLAFSKSSVTRGRPPVISPDIPNNGYHSCLCRYINNLYGKSFH